MSKVKAEEINLQSMLTHLDRICEHCDLLGTDKCKEAQCLIGFARRVLRFALQKQTWDIPGASRLIPTADLKPYYPEQIAPALAETCRQCRQCRDNHSHDCVVALTRTALENALLQESIDYPGSAFLYLARLKEQHPELAALIARELQKKGS